MPSPLPRRAPVLDVPAADFFAGLDAAAAPLDVVAFGGTLDPPTLLAAYRAGCFPWPSPGRDAALEREARRLSRAGLVALLPGADRLVPWCSPDPRAVLLPDRLEVPRSLRQRLRRCGWTCTVDRAFDEVVAACADRDETWISGRMRQAYGALHRGGAAHSVEVWDGDRLVGGLYGVLTGGVFSGESMFHREPDASKVALVDLAARLVDAGVPLLDTQQATPHLARLGQLLVPRSDYLAAVAALRDRPATLPAGVCPAADRA